MNAGSKHEPTAVEDEAIAKSSIPRFSHNADFLVEDYTLLKYDNTTDIYV
jgi:hypothetical protein